MQQTCKVCGNPDKFDYNLPDVIWQSVLPKEFHTRVVCLYCFDDYAKDKGIGYRDSFTKLYFAGKQEAALLYT